VAVPLAVALHKLAGRHRTGRILRAAVKRRTAAVGWCLLAEGTTIVGGVAGLAMAPHLGTQWITYPLGSRRLAVLPGLPRRARGVETARRAAGLRIGAGGVAGAAVIQRGPRRCSGRSDGAGGSGDL